MYYFIVAQVSNDALTATLVAAVLALIGSFVVTVLNATYFETKRQQRKLETEKKALRAALYSEIGWTLSRIGRAIRYQGFFEALGVNFSNRREFIKVESRMESRHKPKIRPEDSEVGWYYKIKSWKDFKTLLFSAMNFDVYDSARKNPALFYQLHDAYGIERFYQVIMAIGSRIDNLDRDEESKPEGKRGPLPHQILRFMEDPFKDQLKASIIFLDLDMLKNMTVRKDALSLSSEENGQKASQLIGELCGFAEIMSDE